MAAESASAAIDTICWRIRTRSGIDARLRYRFERARFAAASGVGAAPFFEARVRPRDCDLAAATVIGGCVCLRRAARGCFNHVTGSSP